MSSQGIRTFIGPARLHSEIAFPPPGPRLTAPRSQITPNTIAAFPPMDTVWSPIIEASPPNTIPLWPEIDPVAVIVADVPNVMADVPPIGLGGSDPASVMVAEAVNAIAAVPSSEAVAVRVPDVPNTIAAVPAMLPAGKAPNWRTGAPLCHHEKSEVVPTVMIGAPLFQVLKDSVTSYLCR